MKKYRSSTIISKWQKTKWLVTHKNLRKRIPKTRLFSKKNLEKMLSTYPTLFFKPTNGSGGVNIIRITRKAHGFQTQLHTSKSFYASLILLYRYLHRFANKRSFLLQKGIQLARTNGRPFDIRVMVQKTNKGIWKSTASFTKIGKAGKVATNYNQGGSIGYLRQTLSRAGYSKASIKRMDVKLKKMGVTVGKTFDKHKKGFRELGLDVALDADRKPWILEVNTRPQFYPLKHMKNKSLYWKIVSYSKQYGRLR